MRKIIYFRRTHGSYIFVAFLLGISAGIFCAMGLKWNFFNSAWWIAVVFLLLTVALIWPTYTFLILGFVAGMVLGFFRVAIYLSGNEANGGVDLWWWTKNLQTWLAERIKSKLPSPEAELGISYLLGVKDDLPEDLITTIRTVGLAHIVVASGTHLSILTEWVQKIFGRISRICESVVTMTFVLIFMAMIGWTPSILRAGIVTGLRVVFGYYGRKFPAWKIILIAIVATLLIDPSFLTDLGWQLSFTSYFGILILTPKITRIFYGRKKLKFLPRTIIATVAATIMTLPITLYYFGSFSLILIVTNTVILPTLPYAMGLTFATGLIASVPLIGDFCAWLTTTLLDFHIIVINFLAEQTYFIVEMPQGNWWVFLLYAPVLLFLLFDFKNRQKMDRQKKFLPGTGHNL